MRTLTGMWEMVVTRVLPGVITAGILAGVALLWTQQADLAAIRTDIAVIKERTVMNMAGVRERQADFEARLRTLEGRR